MLVYQRVDCFETFFFLGGKTSESYGDLHRFGGFFFERIYVQSGDMIYRFCAPRVIVMLWVHYLHV